MGDPAMLISVMDKCLKAQYAFRFSAQSRLGD
jgi:hypothetical protein